MKKAVSQEHTVPHKKYSDLYVYCFIAMNQCDIFNFEDKDKDKIKIFYVTFVHIHWVQVHRKLCAELRVRVK